MFCYIDSASSAREQATVQETKSKQTAAWRCWVAFTISIGFESKVFLDGLSKFQCNIIISAFGQAVRETTFSRCHKEHLVAGTVESTISYVSQAFRANARTDPRLDIDGKICFLLSEQYKGYKNLDGNKKKQKALPLSVLRKMHEVSYNKWEQAVTQLLILAIFFAMRSCKFLQTSHHEESKRTKIIRLKNIIFKKKGRTIHHLANISFLSYAKLVNLTLEFQKNE